MKISKIDAKDAQYLNMVCHLAELDGRRDDHLTIMKFSTEWRIGFGSPEWPADRHVVDLLQPGKTLAEACHNLAMGYCSGHNLDFNTILRLFVE